MPGRTYPLVTNNIYHVFNKSLDHKKIFENTTSNLFLQIVRYYRSTYSTFLRFSNFEELPIELKLQQENKIKDIGSFSISILAYCIMPTHYHFLLRQNQDKGISKFISQIQNSFTKYFNFKYQHEGPIFLHTFRSQPILSEEQLKHISRYIHLNPYSSKLLNEVEEIEKYPWSSFSEYLKQNDSNLSQPENILSFFNENKERYRAFVLGNAAHQKMLEYCKHATRW